MEIDEGTTSYTNPQKGRVYPIKILVTGASGMIGSFVAQYLVSEGYNVIGLDLKEQRNKLDRTLYEHVVIDLSDEDAIEKLFSRNIISHVVHFAALAHSSRRQEPPMEEYYRLNVVNSRNLFFAASKKEIPVLFSSTMDVYGYINGVARVDSKLNPISQYAKTKAEAENVLKRIYRTSKVGFAIYRLAPVYSDTADKDIRKRYYLLYPRVAYIIGKGTKHEVLHIRKIAEVVKLWVINQNYGTWNLKDDELMNTAEQLRIERAKGKASIIVHIPHPLVRMAIWLVTSILGKYNSRAYLWRKAVCPLRSE